MVIVTRILLGPMARRKVQRARTPKSVAPEGVAPPHAPTSPISSTPPTPTPVSAPDELPQAGAEVAPGAGEVIREVSVTSEAVAKIDEIMVAAVAPREPVEVVVPVPAPTPAPVAKVHETEPADEIPVVKVAPARVTPTPRRRLPRKRSLLIGCGLFLAGVVTGGVLVAGWLADQRPGWWEPIDATNPHTVAIADAVENGAVDLLSQVRPSVERTPGVLTSDPWTVKLTPEDVNAWIAVRMPMWIRNQSEKFRWPSEVAQLQVDFREDDIVLGVRAQSHGVERYLWVTLDPTIDEEGALWLKATWVHVGRLSLPAAWFLPEEAVTTTSVTKNIPDDIRSLPATGTLLAALNGAGPVAKNPTVRLADGRRVRIVGVAAEDGALYVTCRTEIRQ